jgi:mannose-6-phosphate isomerase-like protein (cupin superfamily)
MGCGGTRKIIRLAELSLPAADAQALCSNNRKGVFMSEIFPEPIKKLPEADIPLEGIKAYLSQSDTHQIIFMEFEKDVDLPEHSHAAQIGIVLEDKIDLTVDGKKQTYTKGDRYYIPEGVLHLEPPI